MRVVITEEPFTDPSKVWMHRGDWPANGDSKLTGMVELPEGVTGTLTYGGATHNLRPAKQDVSP